MNSDLSNGEHFPFLSKRGLSTRSLLMHSQMVAYDNLALSFLSKTVRIEGFLRDKEIKILEKKNKIHSFSLLKQIEAYEIRVTGT